MVFIVDNISRFFQNRQQQDTGLAKEAKRERRKATKDRRQSVNDGVIVTLSTQTERRSGRDRRKNS